MALDFGAIEAAIATWLFKATGLPKADDLVAGTVSRIIPRNEKRDQPPLPYLDYFVPLPRMPGGKDEARKIFDGVAPAGEEIQIKTFGNREFVCSVSCFTEAASGGTDFEGKLTARAYLSKALSALALPSVSAALAAAGLAFVSVETAQDFSGRLGPLGQGRAMLDVRFRCIDGASETTGYIQTANTQGDLTGP